MTPVESLCIFGDSTSWGAWDLEKGGWANRLWLYVSKKYEGDCHVYNLSVSGGTTKTILERFESEAKIRQADALIFQSGGNDCALMGKNGSNQIPLDVFQKNVEDIIRRAQQLTPNILFIGFKNVDESRTTPVSWRDIYYLNAEIQKYGNAMREICVKHSIPYLDIFGVLDAQNLTDGIHPNASGHEKLFIKVRDLLVEKGWV